MIVRFLLEDLTGISWYQLSLDANATFTGAQHEAALGAVDRLIAQEPIQHILGLAHFYGREFLVNSSVLIPRPETEELIYWVLEEISRFANRDTELLGLDIGTGSGCIPITLYLEIEERQRSSYWHAWDISEAALETARKNAELLGAKVEFVVQDMRQAALAEASKYHLILSNPPYIPERERRELHANVRDYEPPEALFVPDDDPLTFYREIVRYAQSAIFSGGALFFEIHADYSKEVADLMTQEYWTDVEIRKDLRGKPRMVRGFKR